jgi:hypothetical protein
MIEEFEYKGRWRVPDEEFWYNGALKFHPGEPIILEIFGTFNPGMFDTEKKGIILGETTKGDITLVDSDYITHSHSFVSDVTIGKYRPSYIIAGHQFYSAESIQFSKTTFKTFNLFTWLDTAGLIRDERNLLPSEYTKPESLSFKCFEECSGAIDFHHTLNLIFRNNRTEVEEDCSVSLSYNKSRHFKDILMDIYIFNGFITLMTFEQCYPLSISFIDPSYTEDNKAKIIQCFYQNPDYNKKYKARSKGEFLMSFQDIRDEFSNLIRSWYKHYHEIKPVFSLMLYSFRDKQKFNDDKFMDIARAVETFHRRTTTCTKLPANEFELMVSRILEKIDKNDKKWLVKNNSLKYSNELSLKRRLLDLYKTYSSPYLLEQIPDPKRFFQKVVDCRNYYTHYSIENEKEALKGKNLFELNQKLKALLIICICKHIGINDADILTDGLKRNLY